MVSTIRSFINSLKNPADSSRSSVSSSSTASTSSSVPRAELLKASYNKVCEAAIVYFNASHKGEWTINTAGTEDSFRNFQNAFKAFGAQGFLLDEARSLQKVEISDLSNQMKKQEFELQSNPNLQLSLKNHDLKMKVLYEVFKLRTIEMSLCKNFSLNYADAAAAAIEAKRDYIDYTNSRKASVSSTRASTGSISTTAPAASGANTIGSTRASTGSISTITHTATGVTTVGSTIPLTGPTSTITPNAAELALKAAVLQEALSHIPDIDME